MRTLDGIDRTLDADMLVIADAERAVAIGGVMGGANSEIVVDETWIALESAYFQPAAVRRTSKRLGLKTEASIRFERGGDVETPPDGIARAAELMREIGAGRPWRSMIDRYPRPRRRGDRPPRVPHRAPPRPGRSCRAMFRAISGLWFRGASTRTEEPRPTDWTVTVPTFRVDVSREADLIEEVGRHYGFDRIPVTFPPLEKPQPAPDQRIERDRHDQSR